MSPVEAFLGLCALAALSWLTGHDASRRATFTMLCNWTSCEAFVLLSGAHTPWAWFWVIDLFSAIAVTIRPVSRWQAMLAYIYIGQLGIHGWFAIMGGDPLRYLSWLDGLLMLQMLLVLCWTGGHGLNRIWRAHHRGAVRLNLHRDEAH